MIDLHSHVLPGVDDGAVDLDEAVSMCRRAAEDGCRVLVATPHQRNDSWENRDPQRLAALAGELRDRLRETGPELRLGAEILIDSELLDELDDLSASGLLPLAGTRYLLLEFDRRLGPHGFAMDPETLTHELLLAGWRPIYAHPEHIPGLGDDLPLARRLVDQGAAFQITASSVTGEVGPDKQEICEAFLAEGLAHFVASDAHGADWRPTGLSEARRVIAGRWGEEVAARLTEGNARAVLADRPLPVLAEVP